MAPGSRHFDHVHALKPTAAVELDERTLRPHAFPGCQRQITNIEKSDGAAMDRQILLLHVKLVRSRRPHPAFGPDKVLRHFILPPSMCRW